MRPVVLSESLSAAETLGTPNGLYHAAIGEWIFANDVAQEPGTVIPPRSFGFFIG